MCCVSVSLFRDVQLRQSEKLQIKVRRVVGLKGVGEMFRDLTVLFSTRFPAA